MASIITVSATNTLNGVLNFDSLHEELKEEFGGAFNGMLIYDSQTCDLTWYDQPVDAETRVAAVVAAHDGTAPITGAVKTYAVYSSQTTIGPLTGTVEFNQQNNWVRTISKGDKSMITVNNTSYPTGTAGAFLNSSGSDKIWNISYRGKLWPQAGATNTIELYIDVTATPDAPATYTHFAQNKITSSVVESVNNAPVLTGSATVFVPAGYYVKLVSYSNMNYSQVSGTTVTVQVL